MKTDIDPHRQDQRPPNEAQASLAGTAGSGRYLWTIEIAAECVDDAAIDVSFEGTTEEARCRADELADAAPYEVHSCVLHRRAEIPNTPVGQPAGDKS